MKNTAYLYARVSKSSQRLGSSLDIQLDHNNATVIAEKYDCVLSDKVYEDSGKSAFSGANMESGDLRLLIKDIEDGVIVRDDLIIMRSLDRFSRADINKAISTFTDLLNKGIRFYTTMDGKLYDHNNKSINIILASLSFSTANEESLKKSALMNAFMINRINQYNAGERGINDLPYHLGTSIPFHTKLSGTAKNKVVTVHANNHKIATDIVKMVLKGDGLTRIISWLYDEHSITRTKAWLSVYLKSKSLYGTLDINVQDRTRTVFGEYQETYKTTNYVLDHYYPAVCSKERFGLIQTLRLGYKKYKTDVKNQQLLSGRGMLFCGCGASMASNYAKGKGAIYYACIKSGCHSLEQIYTINNIVSHVVTSDLIMEKMDHGTDNKKQCDELQLNIDELRVKLKEVEDLVFSEPKVYGKRYATKILEIEIDIDTKQQLLNGLKSEQFIQNDIHIIKIRKELISKRHELLSGTIEQNISNGELISRMVDKIVVAKNGLITITNKSGKEFLYYIPIQKKQSGMRYATQINIIPENIDKSGKEYKLYRSMKKDKDFSKITFTHAEISNGDYICELENIRKFCGLYSHPDTMLAQDKILIILKDALLKNGDFTINKQNAILNGISAKQWQTHKGYVINSLQV